MQGVRCSSEKVTERHIDRASCDFYGVPRSYYTALREGADFTTEKGKVIPCERLTRQGKTPRSYAYCSAVLCAVSLARAKRSLRNVASYG